MKETAVPNLRLAPFDEAPTLTFLEVTTTRRFAVAGVPAVHTITVNVHDEEELPRWIETESTTPALQCRSRYERENLDELPEAVRQLLVEANYLPDPSEE